ncbi:MAG TPA: CYTH domain-containing protein [Bacteroidales bacterium]|nr:CYTH domain-containing protein [Bacteroidales bacterium]
MATETERKFLVKGDFIEYATKSINIVQAYLFIDPLKTVRIRVADENAYITIKSKAKEGQISRGEWEFRIPVEDAHELIDLCLPGRIIKTRYHVPSGEHLFEVDVFHGKNEGLIIAEIELDSADETFIRPEWLGEEVTGNPAYYNSMLIG